MKRLLLASALTLALIILFFLSNPFARRDIQWQGSGGWGSEGSYNSQFDPSTVQTLRGKIISVERIAPLKDMAPGISLLLQTPDGPLPVHLGPEWYIERQDIILIRGDQIAVKGCLRQQQGKRFMIAEEVVKGPLVLRLRDNQGRPAWSGVGSPRLQNLIR